MNRISRRNVIGGLAAAPFVTLGLSRALAQDKSTPESTPGGSPEASPGASPSASPMASPSAAMKLEVTAIDIAYKEEELTMPADTDVTIVVHNEGMLQHDFDIEDTEYNTELLNGGESDRDRRQSAGR